MFLISMSRTYGVFVALSKVLILIFGLSGSASAAEPIKVMALGDSLTQGYGLPQPDGLVAQLQAWFDTKDLAVEFINAGVSGDTTAGGLDRVAWLLDDDMNRIKLIELRRDRPEDDNEKALEVAKAGVTRSQELGALIKIMKIKMKIIIKKHQIL